MFVVVCLWCYFCSGIFVVVCLWWYVCSGMFVMLCLWWYVCGDSWFVGSGMSAGWADNHGDAAAIKVGKLSNSAV